MRFFLRTSFCFVVFAALVLPANLLHGQVTYTITGFVSDSLSSIPEVAPGESYVAEFEIDLSVPDSDPDDTNRGVYPNAILSSSIVFSGGYTSQVDFAGGEIIIIADLAGGGIFINPPGDDGVILVADVLDAFDSDALFSDIEEQFLGDPAGDLVSIFQVEEPTGFVTSFSQAPELGFGKGMDTPESGPIFLSVTNTVSVLLGDVDLSGAVDFGDISPFIAALVEGTFQEEADFDLSGTVDFFDIPLFIEALTSSN